MGATFSFFCVRLRGYTHVHRLIGRGLTRALFFRGSNRFIDLLVLIYRHRRRSKIKISVRLRRGFARCADPIRDTLRCALCDHAPLEVRTLDIPTGVRLASAEYASFTFTAGIALARVRFADPLDTHLSISADESATACARAPAVHADLIEATRHLSTAKDAISFTAETVVTTHHSCARIIYTIVELTALVIVTPCHLASVR